MSLRFEGGVSANAAASTLFVPAESKQGTAQLVPEPGGRTLVALFASFGGPCSCCDGPRMYV